MDPYVLIATVSTLAALGALCVIFSSLYRAEQRKLELKTEAYDGLAKEAKRVARAADKYKELSSLSLDVLFDLYLFNIISTAKGQSVSLCTSIAKSMLGLCAKRGWTFEETMAYFEQRFVFYSEDRPSMEPIVTAIRGIITTSEFRIGVDGAVAWFPASPEYEAAATTWLHLRSTRDKPDPHPPAA
ncbi:hypothetical protein HYW18_03795 [Candidatus Uhrbacteria bacterium]|nr:hypothetical protein [Candidatus Uhrbacteria bacterium]